VAALKRQRLAVSRRLVVLVSSFSSGWRWLLPQFCALLPLPGSGVVMRACFLRKNLQREGGGAAIVAEGGSPGKNGQLATV